MENPNSHTKRPDILDGPEVGALIAQTEAAVLRLEGESDTLRKLIDWATGQQTDIQARLRERKRLLDELHHRLSH